MTTMLDETPKQTPAAGSGRHDARGTTTGATGGEHLTLTAQVPSARAAHLETGCGLGGTQAGAAAVCATTALRRQGDGNAARRESDTSLESEVAC